MSSILTLIRNHAHIAVITFSLCLFFTAVSAQDKPLEIRVDSVFGFPGQQSVEIPVYLKNSLDSIIAFDLWFGLEQPDLIEFQTEPGTVEYQRFWRYTEYSPTNPDSATDSVEVSLYWVCQEYSGGLCTDSVQLLGYYYCDSWEVNGNDSTCTDSTFIEGYDTEHTDYIETYVGNIITDGTLTEGWNFDVRSLGLQGHDVRVLGSVPSWIPPYDGYIEAHDTEMPLFKLLADVYNVPDTITDSVVHIHIINEMLDHFTFVDNHGDNIGIITDTVPDTAYFRCLEWMPGNEDICLQWERVVTPPYDSISIEDILVARLDTDYVGTEDGSLTVLLCGDIRVDKIINIIDIVDFIKYKYKNGEAPEYLENADVNHDGAVNVLDIAYLIAYKFKGGPAPACY